MTFEKSRYYIVDHSLFTFSCILETSMGTTLDENDTKLMAYKKSIHDLGLLAVHRIMRPWLYLDWIFALTPSFWRQTKITKSLHAFTLDVIKQREKNFTGSETVNLNDEDFVSKKKLAMLDLMLSAKKDGFAITDDGIREEVDTIMFEVYFQTFMKGNTVYKLSF